MAVESSRLSLCRSKPALPYRAALSVRKGPHCT